MKDFFKITRPLYNLIKKDMPFIWESAQQDTLDILKKAFTFQPILEVQNTDLSTRIEVDASSYATERVISQKHADETWHPIAYCSQSMSGAERNYDIYDYASYLRSIQRLAPLS